jgi:hypothetical protein
MSFLEGWNAKIDRFGNFQWTSDAATMSPEPHQGGSFEVRHVTNTPPTRASADRPTTIELVIGSARKAGGRGSRLTSPPERNRGFPEEKYRAS